MLPYPHLISSRLQFTRDARRLIALDRARIIDRGGAEQVIEDVPRAVVGFADQLWIARDRSLEVVGKHAGQLAVASELEALVGAPLGAPAAIWIGQPSLAIVDERTAMPLSQPGLLLPITGRRCVAIQHARVTVPSGLSFELPPATRVTGGAVIFDGTALAIVGERPNGRELSVFGLTTSRLLFKLGLDASAVVRIAPRRGIAAISFDRHVSVVDLRAGRVLHELEVESLIDLAIDTDGDGLALATASGLTVTTVRDYAARPAVVELAPIPVEEAPVYEPEPAPAPLPVTTAPALPVFDLRAFVPIPPNQPIARATALAMLDHAVREVSLWTLGAIARAWDTRALGYGNEGKHPYELEVAALLGMNQGFANDYVAAAREHLDRHAALPVPHPRTVDTPLGLLAAELGLDELAIDVLLVVAAPALWGEAARLYGILANDPARSMVDEQLVLQILAERSDRHAVAATLDPRAPLVRSGAIQLGTGVRPFAALSINPVILARLRGELPHLGGELAVRTSERALEEIVLADGVIGTLAAGLATWTGALRLALIGRPGSGRRTLLAALSAEARRPLGVLDVTQLPRDEREFARALAHGLRAANLAGLLPCVAGLDDVSFGDRPVREVVSETLRLHPGPLAVLQTFGAAAVLPAGHLSVELVVLDDHARLAVWQRAIEDGRLDHVDIADLAARFRIGPGTIHRAVASAVEQRGSQPPAQAVRGYLRQTRDSRLANYARRVERLASWDGLVLPGDIVDSLRELISRVRHRRTVFETWGLGEMMSTSRGLTALFSGPPGTGKTLVAGVIARELGLELYQVDLSKVMSKWIGETERNLGTIFDAAEDGQVILLFDEADSLFSKRTEVRSSNDRYANLEVNYLLQRLDAFEGIAILTTNYGSGIDPAFKRRLSFRLSFPFPDEDTRLELWRAHLPPRLPTRGELALGKLAHKYQLSGGYIRNACLRAAFLAAQDTGVLTQAHLERAVALEFAELGKLSTGGTLD